MFFTKENDNSEEGILIENIQDKIETEKSEEITTKNNIIVYITGCIRKPGVYEMKEGNRISDLIEKAGGVTEEADTTNINLAYKLEDEMKIQVPSKMESKLEEETNKERDSEEYIVRENSNLKSNEKNKNSNKTQKININTANQTELETLPGIGTSTALKIIEYRKQNGKFKNIEDIKNVKGIGENKYNKIKEVIKV